MADPNDKYRNQDAPPGYVSPLELDVTPLPQVYHDPNAPSGLYKFESEANCNKIYFPQFDYVIDLDILNKFGPEDDLSDFVIQTSEEEDSDSPEEIVSKKVHVKEEVEDKQKSFDADVPVKVEHKVRIKTEIEQPDHLFGSYHCTVCNIKMNSESTYDAHVNGKRHKKALKLKNVADTVMKTIPQRAEGSRYPIPAPGICRVQVKEEAIIQRIIVEKLKVPCPGLYEVIEIQGVTETTYYCKLCDSPCSMSTIVPHLGGYKHQLKSLKFFRPDIAKKFEFEPKHKIEKEIVIILEDVARREGLGKVVVEKEFEEDRYSMNDRRDQPSTSSAHYSVPDYDEDSIRDKTKSGFYCKVCESPMNSENMWLNHLTGKRHAANMKKAPGSMPSKLKSIPVPNARAYLLEILEDVREPIVGLDNIRETQNPETDSETYQCLLCHASLTSIDIVDHLLSQKHRKKYLQQIKHPDLEVLDSLNFQDRSVNALIEEICSNAEAEYGRGTPQVLVKKCM